MPKNDYDPEDPMDLVAVELPGGDPGETVDAVVWDYLLMGWNPKQIMFLFQSAHFTMTHQILVKMGEPYVRGRVDRIARQWQNGRVAQHPSSTSVGGDVHA